MPPVRQVLAHQADDNDDVSIRCGFPRLSYLVNHTARWKFCPKWAHASATFICNSFETKPVNNFPLVLGEKQLPHSFDRVNLNLGVLTYWLFCPLFPSQCVHVCQCGGISMPPSTAWARRRTTTAAHYAVKSNPTHTHTHWRPEGQICGTATLRPIENCLFLHLPHRPRLHSHQILPHLCRSALFVCTMANKYRKYSLAKHAPFSAHKMEHNCCWE